MKKLAGQFQQEGHYGPDIAHLNIKTLNDKEQVIFLTINKRRYEI